MAIANCRTWTRQTWRFTGGPAALRLALGRREGQTFGSNSFSGSLRQKVFWLLRPLGPGSSYHHVWDLRDAPRGELCGGSVEGGHREGFHPSHGRNRRGAVRSACRKVGRWVERDVAPRSPGWASASRDLGLLRQSVQDASTSPLGCAGVSAEARKDANEEGKPLKTPLPCSLYRYVTCT